MGSDAGQKDVIFCHTVSSIFPTTYLKQLLTDLLNIPDFESIWNRAQLKKLSSHPFFYELNPSVPKT